MNPVSLANQLKAAQRELAKRERTYPKWVREGKLKPAVAQYELAAQQAIIATLEKLVGLEETTIAMQKQWKIQHPEVDTPDAA